MSPAILNRVIDNDAMIAKLALPKEWRGQMVELRLLENSLSSQGDFFRNLKRHTINESSSEIFRGLRHGQS